MAERSGAEWLMENKWCGLSRRLQVGRSAGGWQADGGSQTAISQQTTWIYNLLRSLEPQRGQQPYLPTTAAETSMRWVKSQGSCAGE